jgi:leucyl/phenylalanyl-tRNA--protein transferase
MADAESPPDRRHGRAGHTDEAGPRQDQVPGEEGSEDWPEGMVARGGKLDPDTLVRAYSAGIFPWSSKPKVTWWSPDPRAIFDLDTFRPHRSLRKSIRRGGWRFTVDREFERVMRACAAPAPDRPSTWISQDFVVAYGILHRRGLAHSVEVWEEDELVGGLYGVTLGAFFGGESMFRRRTDSSKAAVAFLVEHLKERGFTLLDAQVPTAHLTSLGAIPISRTEYLRRLEQALARKARF